MDTNRPPPARTGSGAVAPPARTGGRSRAWSLLQPSRLPSGRALAVAAAVLAAAGGVFVAARETSMFALRSIEVQGAPAPVAARVRAALEPLVGSSLVTFDGTEADRRLTALADVAAASYDRDFPHTLRVFVRPERATAVLRRGAEAWLVSSRARVLRPLGERPYPPLPRIWVARTFDVSVGTTLSGHPGDAARALAPLARMRFPGAVRLVRVGDAELTLVLASGLEVRLGDTGDLPLKLEVARRIVPLAQRALYVDVSVPERSVAGFEPRV